MSRKSEAGKAAWTARAAGYEDDLVEQIVADSRADVEAWAARGRIPLRVRLMARVARRPLRLNAGRPRRRAWR